MEGMEVKVGLVVMVQLGERRATCEWCATRTSVVSHSSRLTPLVPRQLLAQAHHHHQAHLHLHPLHLHHRQLVLTMRIPRVAAGQMRWLFRSKE